MHTMRKDLLKTNFFILTLLGAALLSANTACTTRARGETIVTQNDGRHLPDRKGMTIKGRVTAQGHGLRGVAVSDGIEVVTTDSDGVYYLPSRKERGYVFITLPAHYEARQDGNNPQFFQYLTTKNTRVIEEKNFELTPVDNDKHAILAMADFHLANRNNDLEQFHRLASDANTTARRLRAEGYHVYGLSLGDESWDAYWHTANFDLARVYEELQRLRFPFFHCMGNHDNDPRQQGDLAAEQKWIFTCAPTYYSMNIGRVHYIVLDDISYINDGATSTHAGHLNYRATIVGEEMEWLRRDLALVRDKQTPIVIAMHAPAFCSPALQPRQGHYTADNVGELLALLRPFRKVDILSGHMHLNYNTENGNVYEHNTGAVCATWWETDQIAGNHICCDGTPGGYGVYTWQGQQEEWYYKSSGHSRNYQFRAYDLNRVYINPAQAAPGHEANVRQLAHGYDQRRTDNAVLINVWNYDDRWNIEVSEEGRRLQVTRVSAYDPLHLISYDIPRLREGGLKAVTFPSMPTRNCFLVRASNSTTPLTITVTDRFGHRYTERMERPKAMTTTMD